MLMLYNGLEAGIGTWAFTLLTRFDGLSLGLAAAATAGFWLALTLSRAGSPGAIGRTSEESLCVTAAFASFAAATLLVVFAVWTPAATALVIVLGAGFGPIWPLAFSLAGRGFAGGAGSLSGLLSTAGALGGLAGPWLQGVLLLEHGPRTGMSYTLAGCGAMLACATVATALLRRKNGSHTLVSGSAGQ
jgi:fucose permease